MHLLLPVRARSRNISSPLFHNTNDIWLGVKILKTFLKQLFPPFYHFLHFDSEYFPQHTFFREDKNYRPNETEYLPDLICPVILFLNEVLTFDAITQ